MAFRPVTVSFYLRYTGTRKDGTPSVYTDCIDDFRRLCEAFRIDSANIDEGWLPDRGITKIQAIMEVHIIGESKYQTLLAEYPNAQDSKTPA